VRASVGEPGGRALERRVRAAPHQWLWPHDRWHRARKDLADGTARAGEPLADMERASEVRHIPPSASLCPR
jgi:hypothetical protein